MLLPVSPLARGVARRQVAGHGTLFGPVAVDASKNGKIPSVEKAQRKHPKKTSCLPSLLR